ncbi:MAG: UDP-N-acetylmuramate dehydrogenase [Nitrospiria bacterium]
MSKLTMDKIKEILKDFRGEVKFHEPLNKYTSLKVGGPADVMVFPADLNDLISVVQKIRVNKMPCFILGSGSNLIIREGGIKGLVIKLNQLNHIERRNSGMIFAESGVFLPRLLKFTLEESLTGFEFICQIPGSVGGALKMNAGIPGREIADLLESVKILTFKGDLIEIGKERASFGYRSSKFPNGIILGGLFRLKEAPRHEIQEKIAVLLKKRRETQPLSYPNVGSIFKNPRGNYAGRLIEEVGLKGFQVGGAQISEKHANFIINKGSATSNDILQLIKTAGKRVESEKGIVLELEVKIVGEYAVNR